MLRLSQGGASHSISRYHHQLVRRGTRPTITPVMSDSETSTYSLKTGRLILTPTKKKGSRARSSFDATMEGNEIKAMYLLEDATMRQPITLVLRRDESYW